MEGKLGPIVDALVDALRIRAPEAGTRRSLERMQARVAQAILPVRFFRCRAPVLPTIVPNSNPMDIRAALKEGMARLRAAQIPSHTLATELLLMHALGRDRAWIYSHPEELLDPRDRREIPGADRAARSRRADAISHRETGVLGARVRSHARCADSSPGNRARDGSRAGPLG